MKKRYRKTKEYKELKEILERYFGKPDFIDTLKSGVSFKWYGFTISKNRYYLDNLNLILPNYLFKLVEVKYLNRNSNVIKKEKNLNWIEKVFYNPEKETIRSIRILINLERIYDSSNN